MRTQCPISFVSEDALKQMISKSSVIGDVLECLGLPRGGGGYYNRHLRSRCDDLGIDIDALISQQKDAAGQSERGNGNSAKIPLKDILCEKSSYRSTTRLKERLLREGLLDSECQICGNQGVWMGSSMTLVLDHINGINNDHRIENLRLLCPNCNSQTDTFAGRNKKTVENREDDPCCSECGAPIGGYGKTGMCKSCINKSRDFSPSRKVKNRPSEDQLAEMLGDMTWVAIGEKYGVSDNAVRKWAKSYGLL